MNDKFVRNVLIVAGLVIAGVVGLGVLSTVLTAIVPLTIALAAGFVLGRLSVHFNLIDFVRGRLQAAAVARAAQAVTSPAQTQAAPVKAAEAPRQNAAPAPERLIDEADTPDPAQEAEEKIGKLDFEIRSEAQILEEARRREQEIAQKSAAYDPRAAIEERRKRLLGKTDE